MRINEIQCGEEQTKRTNKKNDEENKNNIYSVVVQSIACNRIHSSTERQKERRKKRARTKGNDNVDRAAMLSFTTAKQMAK